jgi:hypothetical protein
MRKIILLAFMMLSVQRPQVTIEDYQKHIAVCEIAGDLREKYISQLEAKNAELQAALAALTKEKEAK